MRCTRQTLGNFYPRPPRGGRRQTSAAASKTSPISIHALREEGDDNYTETPNLSQISIHALREEGDLRIWANKPSSKRFLSTPSARRATSLKIILYKWFCKNFYPRPPRGGRPPSVILKLHSQTFLSTPSARRATKRKDWSTRMELISMCDTKSLKSTVWL